MFQLYATIWRATWRRQILLILLSVGIAALAAAPLQFQKDIINALDAEGTDAAGLMRLCAGMMGVILLSLGLKWLMGYRSGVLGEDVTRRLRGVIVGDGLREGGPDKGTMAAAVTAEAEELGRFTGAAISEPVVQIGTLVSVVSFIAATQPRLGLLALAIILPQALIVLATQPRVNALVAQRVRILRESTGRITGSDLALAAQQVRDEFDAIYETRRRMFLWKLSTKFVLSTINGAGTVAVLGLGGLLVLQGRSNVGTVVAATSGLARLNGPTTFLIAFYRQVSATRVKYELLREVVTPPTRGAG